jgi:uncharacterized protein (TIGR02996 family)
MCIPRCDPVATPGFGEVSVRYFPSLARWMLLAEELQGCSAARSASEDRDGDSAAGRAGMTTDPRAAEANRIAAGEPVRSFDASTRRWCEEQLDACFAALSELAPDQPPITRGAIEYSRSAAEAVTRSLAAIGLPFDAVAWEHLLRFDRWSLERRRAGPAQLQICEQLAERVLAPLVGRADAERAMVIQPSSGLVALHLATLDAAASPARALAALVTRRVFPIALPDNAVLLYLDACEGTVPQTTHGGELPFLYALACDPDDAATRLVYGDYLEQKGDAIRAERIRGGAELTTVTVNVRHLYGNAAWLLPDHEIARRAAQQRAHG